MGKLTISMAIFNSYVKLPEGIRIKMAKQNNLYKTHPSKLYPDSIQRFRKSCLPLLSLLNSHKIGFPIFFEDGLLRISTLILDLFMFMLPLCIHKNLVECVTLANL
jgi:hypothetical protein